MRLFSVKNDGKRSYDFRQAFYLLLCSLLALSPLIDVRADSGYRIIEDKPGSSLIKISIPKNWNQNVLILAHGLRSPDSPLSADFTADQGYWKVLSDEGWLIASTSYRRNGYGTTYSAGLVTR